MLYRNYTFFFFFLKRVGGIGGKEQQKYVTNYVAVLGGGGWEYKTEEKKALWSLMLKVRGSQFDTKSKTEVI